MTVGNLAVKGTRPFHVLIYSLTGSFTTFQLLALNCLAITLLLIAVALLAPVTVRRRSPAAKPLWVDSSLDCPTFPNHRFRAPIPRVIPPFGYFPCARTIFTIMPLLGATLLFRGILEEGASPLQRYSCEAYWLACSSLHWAHNFYLVSLSKSSAVSSPFGLHPSLGDRCLRTYPVSNREALSRSRVAVWGYQPSASSLAAFRRELLHSSTKPLRLTCLPPTVTASHCC